MPQLREAKVKELGLGLGQHDIARLQIAICHTFSVCFIERVGYLDGILQPLRERFAFEILHQQIINAVLVVGVEERADVRETNGTSTARVTDTHDGEAQHLVVLRTISVHGGSPDSLV